ncbi:MAG: HAMP domain-containing sensor histidine kinase [Ignavibacteriaceae bacterium]|jgi:signal transduction histidine kinase|nr:HAMP domain-containing sensor histidine kinase [Ignavibacteriaceae bacterium]
MFNLVPSWAKHYEEFWLTIRRRNLWFIKLRYVAVAMLLFFIVFPKYFLGIKLEETQQTALLIITFSILVYNLIFHYLRQFLKHDADKFNPLHLSVLQMISDLLALMLVVYFTGSVESPLLLFFVIHMIVGSLILPGFVIYSFAVIIVLVFWGITVGEYYNVIPHYHIAGFLSHPLHQQFNFVLAINASFEFLIFLIVLIANRMANQLYVREQQLLESIDKINTAEKEKQKYISGIVHEIKTPLAAVHSYLDLVLQKFLGPLDEVVEEKLVRARKRSEEAIELINNVLKISKLRLEDSFNKEEVDIASILARAIKVAKVNADAKGVKMILNNKRKDKHKIEGDPFLLQIALSNIISNAIKYNNMDGIVEINVEEDDANLIIKVCDNGIGIPEEDLQKIFTDFFRASNIKQVGAEGSGLGLSVVKQIVERHNGTIDVQSPSHLSTSKYPGTCVKIVLPFIK